MEERRRGVERVEQEVRIELGPERPELRVRQPRLQLQAERFALAVSAVELDGVQYRSDASERDGLGDRADSHALHERRLLRAEQHRAQRQVERVLRDDGAKGE